MKIMYADSKGRLSQNRKGTLILMPGDRSDFEINYQQGIIRHRKKQQFIWNFKPVTQWHTWLEDILIAPSGAPGMNGGNTPVEAYPGEGPAFAAMKNGLIKAAILLEHAPHFTLQFPYLEWKQKVHGILSTHGDVWLGKFEDGNFTTLAKQ